MVEQLRKKLNTLPLLIEKKRDGTWDQAIFSLEEVEFFKDAPSHCQDIIDDINELKKKGSSKSNETEEEAESTSRIARYAKAKEFYNQNKGEGDIGFDDILSKYVKFHLEGESNTKDRDTLLNTKVGKRTIKVEGGEDRTEEIYLLEKFDGYTERGNKASLYYSGLDDTVSGRDKSGNFNVVKGVKLVDVELASNTYAEQDFTLKKWDSRERSDLNKKYNECLKLFPSSHRLLAKEQLRFMRDLVSGEGSENLVTEISNQLQQFAVLFGEEGGKITHPDTGQVDIVSTEEGWRKRGDSILYGKSLNNNYKKTLFVSYYLPEMEFKKSDFKVDLEQGNFSEIIKPKSKYEDEQYKNYFNSLSTISQYENVLTMLRNMVLDPGFKELLGDSDIERDQLWRRILDESGIITSVFGIEGHNYVNEKERTVTKQTLIAEREKITGLKELELIDREIEHLKKNILLEEFKINTKSQQTRTIEGVDISLSNLSRELKIATEKRKELISDKKNKITHDFKFSFSPEENVDVGKKQTVLGEEFGVLKKTSFKNNITEERSLISGVEYIGATDAKYYEESYVAVQKIVRSLEESYSKVIGFLSDEENKQIVEALFPKGEGESSLDNLKKNLNYHASDAATKFGATTALFHRDQQALINRLFQNMFSNSIDNPQHLPLLSIFGGMGQDLEQFEGGFATAKAKAKTLRIHYGVRTGDYPLGNKQYREAIQEFYEKYLLKSELEGSDDAAEKLMTERVFTEIPNSRLVSGARIKNPFDSEVSGITDNDTNKPFRDYINSSVVDLRNYQKSLWDRRGVLWGNLTEVRDTLGKMSLMDYLKYQVKQSTSELSGDWYDEIEEITSEIRSIDQIAGTRVKRIVDNRQENFHSDYELQDGVIHTSKIDGLSYALLDYRTEEDIFRNIETGVETIAPLGWREDPNWSGKLPYQEYVEDKKIQITPEWTLLHNSKGRVPGLKTGEEWGSPVYRTNLQYSSVGDIDKAIANMLGGVISEDYIFHDPSPTDDSSIRALRVHGINESIVEHEGVQHFVFDFGNKLNIFVKRDGVEIEENYREYLKNKGISNEDISGPNGKQFDPTHIDGFLSSHYSIGNSIGKKIRPFKNFDQSDKADSVEGFFSYKTHDFDIDITDGFLRQLINENIIDKIHDQKDRSFLEELKGTEEKKIVEVQKWFLSKSLRERDALIFRYNVITLPGERQYLVPKIRPNQSKTLKHFSLDSITEPIAAFINNKFIEQLTEGTIDSIAKRMNSFDEKNKRSISDLGISPLGDFRRSVASFVLWAKGIKKDLPRVNIEDNYLLNIYEKIKNGEYIPSKWTESVEKQNLSTGISRDEIKNLLGDENKNNERALVFVQWWNFKRLTDGHNIFGFDHHHLIPKIYNSKHSFVGNWRSDYSENEDGLTELEKNWSDSLGSNNSLNLTYSATGNTHQTIFHSTDVKMGAYIKDNDEDKVDLPDLYMTTTNIGGKVVPYYNEKTMTQAKYDDSEIPSMDSISEEEMGWVKINSYRSLKYSDLSEEEVVRFSSQLEVVADKYKKELRKGFDGFELEIDTVDILKKIDDKQGILMPTISETGEGDLIYDSKKDKKVNAMSQEVLDDLKNPSKISAGIHTLLSLSTEENEVVFYYKDTTGLVKNIKTGKSVDNKNLRKAKEIGKIDTTKDKPVLTLKLDSGISLMKDRGNKYKDGNKLVTKGNTLSFDYYSAVFPREKDEKDTSWREHSFFKVTSSKRPITPGNKVSRKMIVPISTTPQKVEGMSQTMKNCTDIIRVHRELAGT